MSLEPVLDAGLTPIVTYDIGGKTDTVQLTGPRTICVNVDLPAGQHKAILWFQNKPANSHLLAVKINAVTIEGMTFDRFKWASKYYPDYPEPWYSEQPTPPSPVVERASYLGWNGRWELEFASPIFEWIHRLEHLGWIYE